MLLEINIKYPLNLFVFIIQSRNLLGNYQMVLQGIWFITNMRQLFALFQLLTCNSWLNPSQTPSLFVCQTPLTPLCPPSLSSVCALCTHNLCLAATTTIYVRESGWMG